MGAEEKILNLSESLKDYTSENLSELVKSKSLSLNEKETASKLKEMMESAGFDEVKIDGLGNVVGRIGDGEKVIAFDGHIDTVDMGNLENWNFDPLSGEIKDGFVHGRGTVDQKSGVASFVTAGKIIKELNLAKGKTIYFTGTVIEEDCDGLCWKYIVEETGIKPDCVVVTEPTNLNIYRGQRGRLEIEVEFRGISSHGSAPERGKNAVYAASKFAAEVEKLNERLAVDEFLGKGTIAVTEFKSNSPSLCAVPDYAKIHIDRRLTWGEDIDLAISQLKEIGGDCKIFVPDYNERAYTGLTYGMQKYYPTWKLEEDHPIILKGSAAFESLFGKKPLIDKWTFSTNGVTINGLFGIPVIGFGPGNEVLAHAPNEKVPVSDLVNASAFYAYFAEIF